MCISLNSVAFKFLWLCTEVSTEGKQSAKGKPIGPIANGPLSTIAHVLSTKYHCWPLGMIFVDLHPICPS